MGKGSKFIPGIYNFCDRWCERCPLTDRCQLYHQESIRRRNPESEFDSAGELDLAVENAQSDLNGALGLIQQVTLERGIDLVEMEEDEDPLLKIDLNQFPIHRTAHRFAADCHRFLDRFCALIQEERRSGPDESVVEMADGFEVLTWHHMQIPVKIDRALSSKLRARVVADAIKDSNGSAKVAYIGLAKSMDILTRAYQWATPLQDQIMPLLNHGYELAEQLDQEFPGHKSFKRPGFDD